MRLLYSLFLLYIILPKIDLIGLGGSAIRVNDLIFIAAAGLFLGLHGFVLPRIRFVNNYFLLSIFALFAMVLNANIALTPLLYVLRPLQYMGWAYIGFACAAVVPRERFVRDMQYLLGFLLLWSLLEAAGIMPKFGKFASAQGRVSANTSGPFEIAAIAAFLLFITRHRLSRGGAFVIMLLAQARINVLSSILILFRQYWRSIALVGALVVPIAVLVPWGSFIEGTRFASIPSVADAINVFELTWDRVPVLTPDYHNINNNYSEMRDVDMSLLANESDTSFEIRIVRWIMIFKSVMLDPVVLFFGYGPAAWGAAVDGYYVRLLGEIGLVGTFAFGWVMVQAFRDKTLDIPAREYLASLLFTSVFIDIFTTDKPMTLLWFYVGLLSWRAQQAAVPSQSQPLRLSPATAANDA
jgi:hypothetical protein